MSDRSVLGFVLKLPWRFSPSRAHVDIGDGWAELRVANVTNDAEREAILRVAILAPTAIALLKEISAARPLDVHLQKRVDTLLGDVGAAKGPL